MAQQSFTNLVLGLKIPKKGYLFSRREKAVSKCSSLPVSAAWGQQVEDTKPVCWGKSNLVCTKWPCAAAGSAQGTYNSNHHIPPCPLLPTTVTAKGACLGNHRPKGDFLAAFKEGEGVVSHLEDHTVVDRRATHEFQHRQLQFHIS